MTDLPKRQTTALVVAVDPPGAWCIWDREGLVAARQGESMQQMATELRRVLMSRYPGRFFYGMVERPHGAHHGNMKSIIVEAITTGWWHRALMIAGSPAPWTPMANQWRKWVGLGGRSRDDSKEDAVRLAGILYEMSGRVGQGLVDKKGKPLVDASEAVCMALATWLRHGLPVAGDVSHQWMMKYRVPYEIPQLVKDDIDIPGVKKNHVTLGVWPKEATHDWSAESGGQGQGDGAEAPVNSGQDATDFLRAGVSWRPGSG